VDGNKFKPYQDIPHHCQVKGDATYMNIAAASVLAKTYRDDRMKELATEYPEYGWERNAGYPTKQHRDAIREFGATPHHRKSFQLLPAQLNLFDD
jgi:ribonuclease HII